VFAYFGVEDHQLAHEFGEAFVKESPLKPHLIPGAREVLEHLSSSYELHIITNGFKEAQEVKIRTSGIEHFFKYVINSEMAGHNKPDPRIFEYSISLVGANKENSIMIGDHLEADIMGAKDFGMDQVYYNPLSKPHEEEITFEVKHLSEIIGILS